MHHRPRSSRILWSAQYAAFRRRLVAARKQSGLSQEEVAKQLGRPQTYVSKSEIGERRVDVVELMEFAKVYRLPLAFFIPPQRFGAGDM